jgi:hypothetical protein
MSYRIYKFGSTELPSTRLTGTFGTGPSLETAIASVGGMHDTQGDGYASLRLPHEIVYSCWIVDTAANTHAKLAAWQAQRGVLAKLYRLNEYDSTEHWCYARLMQVRAPWQYQRKTMQPLELLFYVMTPWYEDSCAGSWVLDDGEVLDDGLFLDAACAVQKTLTTSTTDTTLTGGGNAPTNHVVVSITARTSTITAASVYIVAGDVTCYISWAGTLLADKTLVIDGRNQKVTNDGAPDTGTMTVNTAIHTSNYWLEIAPGSNSLTVTRSGGGATSTADFLYDYCWS